METYTLGEITSALEKLYEDYGIGPDYAKATFVRAMYERLREQVK